MLKIMSLSSLSEGETGEIIQVRGKPDMQRYFHGLGLAMGRSVSGIKVPAENSSLVIKAGDKITSLERGLARNIKVKVTG